MNLAASGGNVKKGRTTAIMARSVCDGLINAGFLLPLVQGRKTGALP